MNKTYLGGYVYGIIAAVRKRKSFKGNHDQVFYGIDIIFHDGKKAQLFRTDASVLTLFAKGDILYYKTNQKVKENSSGEYSVINITDWKMVMPLQFEKQVGAFAFIDRAIRDSAEIGSRLAIPFADTLINTDERSRVENYKKYFKEFATEAYAWMVDKYMNEDLGRLYEVNLEELDPESDEIGNQILEQ